jgi:ankyrin repeat protein
MKFLLVLFAILVIICSLTSATLDTLNDEGMTVLMQAANDNDVSAIENLVSQGATVDFADNDGWTALIWARYVVITLL